MGIGQAQPFQDALHRAVFAEAAMQGVEHRVGFGGFELRHQVFAGIDLDRIEAFFLQGLHHAAAGRQRDLALGGAAAHQHGDAVEGWLMPPPRA